MDYTSQDSIQLVVIGLVSIAAVAMGAATIQPTTELGGAPTIGDQFQPSGGGSQNDSLNLNQSDANSSVDVTGDESGGVVADLATCVEPLAAWYGGLLYFGAFAGVLYGFKRRWSIGGAFLGLYALAPVVFTAYFLSTQCASTVADPGGGNSVLQTIGDTASRSVVPTEISPVFVVAVFGLALIAVAVVLLRASGDQTVTTLEEEPEEEGDLADVEDLAAAAGRAADRLEKHDADVDNEVYRAWWEMTSLLSVPDPASSTPGEFAEAAVETGLDEDDVAQLTRLFEEVRYGRRDPESREDRAIEVFRAIETQYGEAADEEGDDGR